MELERNQNRNWVETGAVNTPGKAQQVMTCEGVPPLSLSLSLQPDHVYSAQRNTISRFPTLKLQPLEISFAQEPQNIRFYFLIQLHFQHKLLSKLLLVDGEMCF